MDMRLPAAIDKPEGNGRIEQVSLNAAAAHLLEECRMVLPGIQALFGFQLIAVFHEGFSTRLDHAERLIHLGAIGLVILAIALVMAPAAIHRQSEPCEVSERFVWLASVLVLAGMAPLAVGLALDVYLIARVILGSAAAAGAVAGSVFLLFFATWVLLPRHERLYRKRALR